MERTLTVDCGGSELKAAIVDDTGTLMSEHLREPTPYPLPPERLVETIVEIGTRLGRWEKATVGMPGVIREGIVVATPHYTRPAGPYTTPDPALETRWRRHPIQTALQARLQAPVLVLNDAQVQAAGAIRGEGFEAVATLGTGLGFALAENGVLLPHLEMSHAPFREGETYDQQLGEPARQRTGTPAWTERVHLMVAALRPVLQWDTMYIGGGNSRLLPEMGPDIQRIPNIAGVRGGARVWSLLPETTLRALIEPTTEEGQAQESIRRLPPQGRPTT